MPIVPRALKALSIGLALSSSLPSYSQTLNEDQLDFDDLHSRALAGLPMKCSEFDAAMVLYTAVAWPEAVQATGVDTGVDPSEVTLDVRRASFGFVENLAERGHIPAMLVLANAYADGAPALPENDRRAFEWALRSAKLGSVDGMLMVSTGAFFGEGTEQDMQQAYLWALIAEARAFGNENASIADANNISIKGIKEEILQFLSFEQIQETQDLAANWDVEAQESYCSNDPGPTND